MATQKTVAFIGGSGLYKLESISIEDQVEVDTPFGAPSGPITIATVEDVKVLFLPRHDSNHGLLPHEVPYQANIFALKTLGSDLCIAVNAAGSLSERMRPGDVVIPHQLIDFTKGRKSTFFGQGLVAYPSMADPISPELHKHLSHFGEQHELPFHLHSGGTYLCIDGPHFSTRAESTLFRSWNADLIGMTMATEAKLAREAELPYASLCLISDYDCWREDEGDVNAKNALEVLQELTAAITTLVPSLARHCASFSACTLSQGALDNALLTRGEALKQESCRTRQTLVKRFLG